MGQNSITYILNVGSGLDPKPSFTLSRDPNAPPPREKTEEEKLEEEERKAKALGSKGKGKGEGKVLKKKH